MKIKRKLEKKIYTKEEKKQRFKIFMTDLFFILVACTFAAFSTTAVLVPNGLTSGGITGVVRIIQGYVDINYSVGYYVIAFSIFVVVIITLGWKEAQKALIASIIFPVIISIFEILDIKLLEERDIMLAAIFCGVFYGLCSGIVFSRGYMFFGSESVAKIIKKKLLPQVDISKILLCVDSAIIIASAAVFGRNIALYALVTQFISAKAVDFVLYGLETKIVQLVIISKKPEEIIDYVTNDLRRGISSRMIVGEYTGEQKKELVVLCSPREGILIKKFLARQDPAAFVTILHVDTVFGIGKGFTDIEKDEQK